MAKIICDNTDGVRSVQNFPFRKQNQEGWGAFVDKTTNILSSHAFERIIKFFRFKRLLILFPFKEPNEALRLPRRHGPGQDHPGHRVKRRTRKDHLIWCFKSDFILIKNFLHNVRCAWWRWNLHMSISCQSELSIPKGMIQTKMTRTVNYLIELEVAVSWSSFFILGSVCRDTTMDGTSLLERINQGYNIRFLSFWIKSLKLKNECYLNITMS